MYIKDNTPTITISNVHISTQKEYKKLRRFDYLLNLLIRLFFPKNIRCVEITYESCLFTGITFYKKNPFDKIFYDDYHIAHNNHVEDYVNGIIPCSERDYYWICNDCGTTHGHMDQDHIATWHYDRCDICRKQNVPVTEPRDFNISSDLTAHELRSYNPINNETTRNTKHTEV